MGFEIGSILAHLVAAAIGVGATSGYQYYKRKRRTAGQAALLCGLEGANTLFVFPPREMVEGAHIPRTSTEDFLAISNLISAFQRAGLAAPENVRDSVRLTDDEKRHNHLVLICSSKTNRITQEALEKLHKLSPQFAERVPYFESEPSGQFVIKWNRGLYPSASFTQPIDGPLEDIALIVKARSPWAAQHKILIVAGIRGFGTWGAAKALKKNWKPLYERKDSSRQRKTSKEGEFAALLAVRYEKYDIKETKLIGVSDLDDIYPN